MILLDHAGIVSSICQVKGSQLRQHTSIARGEIENLAPEQNKDQIYPKGGAIVGVLTLSETKGEHMQWNGVKSKYFRTMDKIGNEEWDMKGPERPLSPGTTEHIHPEGGSAEDKMQMRQQSSTEALSTAEQPSQKDQESNAAAPCLTLLKTNTPDGLSDLDPALDPGVALFEDVLLINVEQMYQSDGKNDLSSVMQSSSKVSSRIFEDHHKLIYHDVLLCGANTSFESWPVDEGQVENMDWDESLQMFCTPYPKSQKLEEKSVLVQVEFISRRCEPHLSESVHAYC